MKVMPWIHVDGQSYTLEEITKKSLDQFHSAFSKATISFCKSWLDGQQEFFIQTSGSTGSPKEIRLLRSQMEASAWQTIEALELAKGETSLICLDTRYIAGQMMLVRSLLAGMNIIAVEPCSNPWKKLDNPPIDFVALVPYQLEAILIETPERLNHVHRAIIGGAAITHSLKERTKSYQCKIFATYGMTETLSHIALQRLNGPQPDDYFSAFSSVDLRVDNRGCLCIKANYLPEEIITNDLVELVDLKKFRWLGRIDNVINSGGIKVIPEKVEIIFEKILHSFSIKNRFFITALPDEKLGNKVVILFEGFSFTKEIQEDILMQARQQLTKYEIPKAFLFVNEFKETGTGKVNRAATLALL